MDQERTREDRLAHAARSRDLAQDRKAERAKEIAGKQSQLKLEAQKRREKPRKPASEERER